MRSLYKNGVSSGKSRALKDATRALREPSEPGREEAAAPKAQGRGSPGANVNLPLPWGTESSVWLEALSEGARRIAAFAPDALVVSLGLDTYKEDPISHFLLSTEDYLEIGRRIARLGLRTVFVLEGGYAIAALGANAVNVLSGFGA